MLTEFKYNRNNAVSYNCAKCARTIARVCATLRVISGDNVLFSVTNRYGSALDRMNENNLVPFEIMFFSIRSCVFVGFAE